MVGIDTVILTLKAHEFALLEPSRFTPHAGRILGAEAVDMGRNKYFGATCNPSKQETAIHGYLPYLTLYRALRGGGLVTELRIQFSAPKMLYGNNFDEPEEYEFGELCHRLLDALEVYKIKVRGGLRTIADAQVATVHYSKNFVLTNYLSARQAILDLQKSDVSAWRDVSQTDYVNSGYGFKTHSKYHELAFYDKLAEYNKGKRGQPTFDTDRQMSFDFDKHAMRQPFEVLRMEVRFGNSKAIKRAFEQARLPTDDLRFTTIFRQDFSQMVLEWHLQDHYSRYPKIAEATNVDLLELFGELYMQNPGRRLSSIVNAVGIHALAKDAGTRKLKDIVGPEGSQALLRLAKRANRELRYKAEKSEVFELLAAALDRFEPVHLHDFVK
ncbi:MAG TPA: phage/plasmid replication protein [Candidatus Saccharimonadales bacterium]|nr:phage/plasmid replication protein [Candidatus Saccharimonadales bacterium]